MTAFLERFKHELVLCFQFRQVGKKWTHIADRPSIIRIANQDCSQMYRTPVPIGRISDGYVEVRIYDDSAIDTANDPSLLGDWNGALLRCEEFITSTRPAAVEKLYPYEDPGV